MKSYFNFKNKKILIIGGSSGFGSAIARVFNGLGANVIISARRENKLKEVIKSLKYKKKASYICCDINEEKDVDNLIAKIKEKHSYLNIVIFCCGINIRSKFIEINIKDFKQVLNTNFASAIYFYKKIYPLIMLKKHKTRIINFTSIFSNVTFENRTSYSTSKAALKMLTKNMALELASTNTTVNCISPGPFKTEINKPVLKNKKNYLAFCEKIPLKRFGNIDEIISPVLFLSSDYSSYITGSEIIIDGGWSIK